LRQTLHDGCLTHTGLTEQNRVVLRSTQRM
jgi:hypothetical protein